MFFKKILNLKEDVEMQFMADDDKSTGKASYLLERRKFQINTIL